MSLRLAKPRVYLETTIPSYLTARPASDPLKKLRQDMTKDWWAHDRHAFELFTSNVVLNEAMRGDEDAVEKRVIALGGIPRLAATLDAVSLMEKLTKAIQLPKRAEADAAHLAIAAIHGMDYLLTWNCKHIANRQTMEKMQKICADMGYRSPMLCTPELLQELS